MFHLTDVIAVAAAVVAIFLVFPRGKANRMRQRAMVLTRRHEDRRDSRRHTRTR